MNEPSRLFLDANTLASPVTRTLIIAGARVDGLRWTWSQQVETEADRHARGRASRTSSIRRNILGTELSPTAPSTQGLDTKTPQDRQVIADAIESGARYLITTDVDDFAFSDLAAHAMSAVNPDYFMACRFTEQAYREGVDLLATVQKNPSRTGAEVHRMLGRRHPHLTARFARVYHAPVASTDPDQPSLLFRGITCIRCAARLDLEAGMRTGLCVEHMPILEATTQDIE